MYLTIIYAGHMYVELIFGAYITSRDNHDLRLAHLLNTDAKINNSPTDPQGCDPVDVPQIVIPQAVVM